MIGGISMHLDFLSDFYFFSGDGVAMVMPCRYEESFLLMICIHWRWRDPSKDL